MLTQTLICETVFVDFLLSDSNLICFWIYAETAYLSSSSFFSEDDVLNRVCESYLHTCHPDDGQNKLNNKMKNKACRESESEGEKKWWKDIHFALIFVLFLRWIIVKSTIYNKLSIAETCLFWLIVINQSLSFSGQSSALVHNATWHIDSHLFCN